ncbi:MAG TPA: TlpA disulfide reductase family protein [Planctomycetaceae bacterium]|nr:TlpA disulfide reductase family protein [Planctomycetaceae bacterium]
MSLSKLRLSLGSLCFCWGLVALGASGCGKSEVPAGNAAPAAAPEQALPAVAIAGQSQTQAKAEADDDDPDDADPDDDKAEIVVPKEGTPEWLTHEATKLLLSPPPQTEDLEALKTHRRAKNEKVVQLSQQAIKQIHDDKEKERLLNMAVHNLMEARMQLALSGDHECIDSLYEDAEALFKRDPKSAAAAEGAHALVNFAYLRAKESAAADSRCLKEFARQACHFAKNFTSEERRSLPLLFTAGRSCEIAGLMKEALECYTLLQQGFPKSQYAISVGPIMRRLKLVGRPPQLAGPTIDGDQLAVDDLLGRVVLIVFWSAEVRPFLDQLPALSEISRKLSKQGLTVIGVNLDQDADLVQQFVVKHKIPWPQIFYKESDQRGWNNPIVTYYGIMELPAIWLIDQSGNVVSTNVKIDSLAAHVEKLLGGVSTADKADGKPNVKDSSTPKADSEPPAQGEAKAEG